MYCDDGPESEEGQRILGRGEHDHAGIFPRFTTASAACAGEVQVNGRSIKIWEFTQLEGLAVPILRQRAMAIKDALGNACPPLPSSQRQQLIQWILHMQGQLTQKQAPVGRQGVPKSFDFDSQKHPIQQSLERRDKDKAQDVPFGPRFHDTSQLAHPGRDRLGDLLAQRNEFEGVPAIGLQSMRNGGEGRRSLKPQDNMDAMGLSNSTVQGIQSLKGTGEGRRFIAPEDHVASQKRDMEAEYRGDVVVQRPPPAPATGMKHILTPDHVDFAGESLPLVEPNIGETRRKHISPTDHMVGHGIAHDPAARNRPLRKQMQTFSGAKASFSGTHGQYEAGWKSNPSRLHGTSMLA
jgi:hypothetical protein